MVFSNETKKQVIEEASGNAQKQLVDPD